MRYLSMNKDLKENEWDIYQWMSIYKNEWNIYQWLSI